MASWHYAFFFPSSVNALESEQLVDVLEEHSFELDQTARKLISIDDDGHFGEFGEEVPLGQSAFDELRRLLRDNVPLFIECRHAPAAANVVITLAVSFETQAANPHIYCGWPRNLFARLPDEITQDYWTIIREFAKACRAAYVVLVDDARDDFEDRFLEIDERRVLDTEVLHSYGHGIQAVWVDPSALGTRPEGVQEKLSREFSDGFLEYSP